MAFFSSSRLAKNKPSRSIVKGVDARNADAPKKHWQRLRCTCGSLVYISIYIYIYKSSGSCMLNQVFQDKPCFIYHQVVSLPSYYNTVAVPSMSETSSRCCIYLWLWFIPIYGQPPDLKAAKSPKTKPKKGASPKATASPKSPKGKASPSAKASPKSTASPKSKKATAKVHGTKCRKPDDDNNAIPESTQDKIKTRKFHQVYDALPDATKELYEKAFYENTFSDTSYNIIYSILSMHSHTVKHIIYIYRR